MMDKFRMPEHWSPSYVAILLASRETNPTACTYEILADPDRLK